MKVVSALGRIVTVGLFSSALAVAACGGGAASGPGAQSAPTAQEVGSLKFKLGQSQSSKVDQAIQQALVASGYTVVTSGDADVELAPNVTAKPAVMAISINGKQKLDITVVLNASSNGQVLDQATTEFTAAEDDVSPDDVKPLIAALNQHGKIASFARTQQAKAAADAKAASDKAAADQAAKDAAAEAAWKDADPDGCKAPTKADSCRKLEGWLQENPTGKHADEARQILKDSVAKLATLEDDQAWTNAKADDCKAPKQSDDCSGVQNYVTSYPQGGHLAEAKAVLAASAPKVAQLKASENAAQKAADLADCQKDCKQNTCQWLMGSARYGVCVANCFQSCQ